MSRAPRMTAATEQLLAAISAATAGAVDLAEAARDGGRGLYMTEVVENLADACAIAARHVRDTAPDEGDGPRTDLAALIEALEGFLEGWA